MDLEFKKKQSVLTKYHIDPDTKKPTSVPVIEKQQVHPLKNLIQMVGEVKKNKKIQIIDRDMIPVNKPEKITQPYHYYVDYEQNLIHFHPDVAGQTIEYKYEDMGVTVISANKIFTKQDEKGNVIELLEDIIRLGREAIDVMETIGGVAIVMKRLEDDIKEGYEVSQQIQDDIQQAKDEVINVQSNKEVIIKASEWILNGDGYEKEITHTCNSENLHVTAKNSDTKEATTIGYKILDKTRILLKSDEAINMSVILSASYYHATQTISDDIAEEVVKARKGETGLDVKITKIEEELDAIASLSYAYDVNDTSFKAGQKVDVENLKMTQIKNLTNLYHNLRKGKAPVRFCHRGDSLTFGYDSTSDRVTTYTWANGDTYTYNQAQKTYPEAMEEMLKTIYGNNMILSHINRGRGGDNAKGSLIRHNGKHDADCTLLMIGTNDSRNSGCPYVGDIKQYLYWLEQVIIQELSWDKCVILLSPPLTKLQSDYDVDSFANGMKYLANKWNIPFVDTQELLIGYDESIWSDVTHLSTFGYTILGTKLAACFIGEGLLNPNKVSSGKLFEASLMTSSTYYTNGDVTYSHSPSTDTPPHNTINSEEPYGYLFMIKNTKGKIYISLYCEEDNLCFIPSAYIRAGGYSMKVLLDNGLKSSENILDSSIFNKATFSDENLNSAEYISDTSMRVDKIYFRNNLIYPLRITTKGWHLIEISGDSKNGGTEGPCNFMGYEIISYNDMYNIITDYANKPQNLYTAVAQDSSGLVRPVIGDRITLSKNISLFDTLYVTTGGVSNGDYTTFTVRGFNGLPFRPSLDYINILTKGLTWITLKIIDEYTLEYVSVDNQYPLRDIFGNVSI